MPRPDHLSPTQKGMFEKCPLQYWFRYMKGLTIRPSGARKVGSRTHETLEENFRYKLKTVEDLPVQQFLGVWESGFDLDLQDPEVDWEGKNPGDYRTAFLGADGKKGLLHQIRETHIPPLSPRLVEHSFLVQMGTVQVMGILDFYGIDGGGRLVVRDFKTGGAAKTQAEVDVSDQLTLYHYYLKLQKKPVEAVALDSFVHGLGRGSQKISVVQSNRTTKDHKRLVTEFTQLDRQIDHLPEDDPELWPKTQPENWWCSEKWCGYWKRCPRGGGKFDV